MSCCEYVRCCMLTGESCWCFIFGWRVLLASETRNFVLCRVVKWSCSAEWPLLTAGPTFARKCHATVHAITGASPYAWFCKFDVIQGYSIRINWIDSNTAWFLHDKWKTLLVWWGILRRWSMVSCCPLWVCSVRVWHILWDVVWHCVTSWHHITSTLLSMYAVFLVFSLMNRCGGP